MKKRRTIVVTGVSRGLGLALVEEFVRLGHRVFGCARSKDAIAELGHRWPAPHRFEALDVSDDVRVRAWAKRVLAASLRHPPDLIVNNAAAINCSAPLWKVTAEEFSQVVDINIKGVTSVLRYFLPGMIKRRSGVIVNMSSGWGRSVSADVAPYCATKWAIEGLTRALAEELPRGMAAVPLNPGIIDTDMLRSCFGGSAASYPSPREWAGVAADFILRIGPQDNGRPLSVRGF